jgi:hypothetical protein
MNKNQKIALGIGLAVFVISLLFVPWTAYSEYSKTTYTGRTPFWNVENEGQVNAPAMLLDWAIMGILTGGAMLLLKRPRE